MTTCSVFAYHHSKECIKNLDIIRYKEEINFDDITEFLNYEDNPRILPQFGFYSLPTETGILCVNENNTKKYYQVCNGKMSENALELSSKNFTVPESFNIVNVFNLFGNYDVKLSQAYSAYISFKDYLNDILSCDFDNLDDSIDSTLKTALVNVKNSTQALFNKIEDVDFNVEQTDGNISKNFNIFAAVDNQGHSILELRNFLQQCKIVIKLLNAQPNYSYEHSKRKISNPNEVEIICEEINDYKPNNCRKHLTWCNIGMGIVITALIGAVGALGYLYIKSNTQSSLPYDDKLANSIKEINQFGQKYKGKNIVNPSTTNNYPSFTDEIIASWTVDENTISSQQQTISSQEGQITSQQKTIEVDKQTISSQLEQITSQQEVIIEDNKQIDDFKSIQQNNINYAQILEDDVNGYTPDKNFNPTTPDDNPLNQQMYNTLKELDKKTEGNSSSLVNI